MTFNKQDYAPISIRALTPGMNIDFEIYYEKDGVYVLLCKDALLTDELIAKLKTIAFRAKNIYVPVNRRHRMLQESGVLGILSEELKPFEGYGEIKTESKALLDAIQRDDAISKESTTEITKTIEKKLDVIDAASIIHSINTLRLTDEYLHTHSVNVSLLNGLIGKWKQYDADSISDLVLTGLLHDIGKLKIPPEILNKPGKLTDEEFEKIKAHSSLSHEMIVKMGGVADRVLYGVLQHHEKVNGKGYPDGLTFDDIDEFARITAVSDVYDAMVAKRVYKDANSPFKILAWFAEGRFSELDIELVNIFLRCMADELTGKYVVLSNGAVAQVMFVNQLNLEYPIVKIDDDVFNTNSELYTESMYSEDSLTDAQMPPLTP